MDDHSDKQQLYEVSEMKDFKEEADNEEFVQQMKDAGYVHSPATGHQSVRQTVILILLVVIVLLLGVLLIFQAATMYQVSTISPSEADCSTPSSTAGSLQGNGDNTNNGGGECDFSGLLKALNASLSLSDFQQSLLIQNNTDTLQENLATTQDAVNRLLGIIGTLANIEDNSINTGGTINDILLKVQQVLQLQNMSSQSSDYKSCQDIKNAQPNSPSGHYHINSQIVYCEMGDLCNDTNGGWTRVAYLDMADSTVNCPPELNLVTSGIVRACGRPVSGIGNCASVKFPSIGVSYSEVCGRVIGYQYNSPDAVDTTFITPDAHASLDKNYVDGVSITHGFPRTHIWTLMGGLFDSVYSDANCPCNNPPGNKQDLQPFIGNDYFCESGTTGPFFSPVLYTADPLWDGKGCGSQEGPCCSAAGLPWFYKTIDSTTNQIELRVCGDQATWDEDVPVSFYEIYVR